MAGRLVSVQQIKETYLFYISEIFAFNLWSLSRFELQEQEEGCRTGLTPAQFLEMLLLGVFFETVSELMDH